MSGTTNRATTSTPATARPRTAVPGASQSRFRPRAGLRGSAAHRVVLEITTTRRRPSQSSARIAIANGATRRYGASEKYGFSTACAIPIDKPAEERPPERVEPSDQRRSEREGDEEGQRRVVERLQEVGEQQARRAAHEPGAEPCRRFDAADGHPERGADLAIVRRAPASRCRAPSGAGRPSCRS